MAIGLGRMFGFRFPENFNRPVLGGLDHRLLAALAHDAVALVPRLRLHPARRQPRVGRRTYRNLVLVFLAHGLLARRGLDVRGLGRLPRRAASLLERRDGPARVGDGRRPVVVLRRARGDIAARDRRLGAVPRRHTPDAGALLRAMFTPRATEVDPRVDDALTNQALIVGRSPRWWCCCRAAHAVGRLVAAEPRTPVAATGRRRHRRRACCRSPWCSWSRRTFSPFLYFRF